MKKIIKLSMAFAVVALAFALLAGCSLESESKEDSQVSFIAVGDAMCHEAMLENALQDDGSYDFSGIYREVGDYIDQFDVRFANVECVVNNVSEPAGFPRFSTPFEYGEELDKHFNMVSLSNNHCCDVGMEGIASALDFWNGKDVTHAGYYTGDDDADIKYTTVKGIKIALLAYTASTNGHIEEIDKSLSPHPITLDDRETIERQVTTAKENADLVIVSCHMGAEDCNFRTKSQNDTAHWLNEIGADVILGTHPHVLQDIEWLTNDVNDNKTLVAYSLGNFVSAQSKSDNLLGGMFEFDIVKTQDANGNTSIEIENPHLIPIVTQYGLPGERDFHVMFFDDYNEELASQHGVTRKDWKFSYVYLKNIVEKIVPEEYLKIDPNE